MPENATFRVMALHALAYCERLFYLEEVEEVRVADERVWAGRTLHEELDEPAEVVELTMESAKLGIRGRVDAVRCRSGELYPIEHKKGRSRRMAGGDPGAWDSDRLQALAYALLLAEHANQPVREVRIRYHKDNVTVRVPITDTAPDELRQAVSRARDLASSPERPAVSGDDHKCIRCSLAPVCLPEEARFALALDPPENATLRLFPPDTERRSLHVVTHGSRVGRSGGGFRITDMDGAHEDLGAREVSDIVVHGHAQITTQALRLCADEGIPVHFVTMSGSPIGTFAATGEGVQRRIRQYRALSQDDACLALAKRLIQAKLENELRHLLRASRKEPAVRARIEPVIADLRHELSAAARAEKRETLLGHEGMGARAYFRGLAELVDPALADTMAPRGRSRQPPEDRFNALLSFAYGLLYRDMLGAILRVGLEPALGVLHQPRSSAMPLALDLMELFRTPVVDVAILGAVNRRTFDPEVDFSVAGPRVWLSESGRRKLIDVFERRKQEENRHTVVQYSLSFARLMELEVRLLEKEWMGEGGLFGRFRIR